MSTEGFQPSRLAHPKRTLARLIVKSFLGIRLLQIQIINFMIFCTFCCRHANHLSWRMDWKLFILFKICIAITILEFIQKLRPFRNFSTYQPLCITSTTLYKLFIFFVQIAIDFSGLSFSDSNFYILSVYYSSQ